MLGALSAIDDDDDLFVGSDAQFFAAPAGLAGLATLYAEHPGAVLVAGATDVGLWITKKLQALPQVIWLGRVRGLDAIEDAARRRDLRRDGDPRGSHPVPCRD